MASLFLSDSGRRTHMFDRLTKKIIAAVVIVIVSDKVRSWAKK
jgi:hypothetical protein